MPAKTGTRADFHECGSTNAASNRPFSERPNRARSPSCKAPWANGLITVASTPGNRVTRSSRCAGVSTVIRPAGSAVFSRWTSAPIITASPSQLGPTIRRSTGPPTGVRRLYKGSDGRLAIVSIPVDDKARPRCVAETRDRLGEGPFWHEGEGRLYWFDIKNRKLNWYAHDSGEQGRFDL